MIKLTFSLRRLPHLNETLRRGRVTPEPYDGVAELWWDSVEDLALWVSEEHVVV